MILVLDSTDMDLAKNAYAQLKDFGVECETKTVDALNIPREIAQGNAETFLVALNREEDFAEQIIAKILDLEEEEKVVKLILKKENESQELFEKRSKRLMREKAEKIAEETTM